VTVTFAERLARMPGYQAGVPTGQAPEAIAAGGIAQLASNESPFPPHPQVIAAIERAAASMHRYPDPDATLLRRRIAERYDAEPSRVAVGNGSCEILLAAAEALCEPGAEILYGWPAFSMYPYLAALTGAREVKVPLDAEDTHDLEAMATEITAATQLVLVCNPNNPTGTHLPASAVAAFCERVPQHVTVILDEAYVEFQVDDDPDASLDLLRDFPNLVVLRTFSKCYGLAGLRVGYAIGSAGFRSAVDAVRQPFSVNALAQAAGAEAILHQDDVERRVTSTIAERLRVEEVLREIGLQTAETQANFSWIRLPGDEGEEARIVAGLADKQIAVRPGTPLGAPGRLRVTYGTQAENDRFLSAFGELLD
jgi:histidinol-phosphate aminotransferase